MPNPREAGSNRASSSRPSDGDDRGSATRRGVLSTVIAALFAGTVATQYVVRPARADAAVSGLTVDGDAITSDSGQLTGLTASVSGHTSYDGLDGEASSVVVELYVAPSGGATAAARNRIASSTTNVADAAGLEARAGHLDFAFAGADVLAADDLSASAFAATGDGTTKETDVDFGLALTVLDQGGSQLVGDSTTTTATITVTNQSRQGNAQGSGSTTARGTNQSP